MPSDLGLLILRLVLGLTLMGHGGQKLFGYSGGPGFKGWIGIMTKIGLRPAWFWALIGALSEFVGGVLVVLGLFAPLGEIGIIASMLIAIIQVHWSKGFWNSKGGFEFPLMNLAAALALGLTGPGAYSLDAVLHISLPEPLTLVLGLGLVILGAIVALASRSLATVPASESAPRS